MANRKSNLQYKNDGDTDSTTSDIDEQNTSSDISLSDLIDTETAEEMSCDGIAHVKEIQVKAGTKDKENSKIVINEHALNQYVAILYTEPKLKYYWGKILKTFEDEEDAEVNKIEVEFLKQKSLSSNPKLWTWHSPMTKEVEILDVKYVIFGPCIPEIKAGKLYFPDCEASSYLSHYGKFGHL